MQAWVGRSLRLCSYVTTVLSQASAHSTNFDGFLVFRGLSCNRPQCMLNSCMVNQKLVRWAHVHSCNHSDALHVPWQSAAGKPKSSPVSSWEDSSTNLSSLTPHHASPLPNCHMLSQKIDHMFCLRHNIRVCTYYHSANDTWDKIYCMTWKQKVCVPMSIWNCRTTV